jgi:cell division transport system permease protein
MLIFWFKEALKIFSRAKSSFILSLISLSISIMLIAASFYSIFLSQKIERKIKEQFTLNIFLNDSLSIKNITDLKTELTDKNFTSSIAFIDKEKAAETFIKDTGEDFRKILDYNPIPASFSLKLKANYVDKDSIEIIKRQLNNYAGIDEIVFEHEVLEKLVDALKGFQKYIFIITAVLILISIYITYSTIKLVITLKRDELETMKLVGAKLSTIKMPIILNEIFTGLLASLLSYVIIKILIYYVSRYESLTKFYEPPNEILGMIFLIGPAISLIVSVFVLRKITLKI